MRIVKDKQKKKQNHIEKLNEMKSEMKNYKYQLIVQNERLPSNDIKRLRENKEIKVYFIKKSILDREFKYNLKKFKDVLIILSNTESIDFTFKDFIRVEEISPVKVVNENKKEVKGEFSEFNNIIEESGSRKFIKENSIICEEGEKVRDLQVKMLKTLNMKIFDRNLKVLKTIKNKV
ncbi:hypothetical protein HERIO_606 [Hepatospora eriocheir]|uniref:Uncharacterized protein n=1 Tax=Hepatospora eriocheir TaxID=1081669 RepID=A0A1X0QCX7_9MICR|nr:hypothetical protein HERIO_606 [Hepatospora eriocheir]